MDTGISTGIVPWDCNLSASTPGFDGNVQFIGIQSALWQVIDSPMYFSEFSVSTSHLIVRVSKNQIDL